ncbi:hypothetical protein [Bacillus manliponensis]|uniref:hypothetical protein n=1 Tax=Bacillus manliponensis TaxID=574376 RepID=UPI0035184F0F
MKKFIKPLLVASIFSLAVTTVTPLKGYAEELNNNDVAYKTEENENMQEIYFPTDVQLQEGTEENEASYDLFYEEVLSHMDPNLGEPEIAPRLGPAIPFAVAAIMRIVPKAIKVGSRHINLKKFTTKFEKTKWKDPDSKWMIERDKGNNPHGGSYWKLLDHKGKRKATLDKNGKVLRD